jgi:hypothetical protein
MSDYLKYVAGAALFLLWAVLVIYLKLDPNDLIGTIKIAILALLGFAGVTKLQAAPSATSSPAKPGLPTVPLRDGS